MANAGIDTGVVEAKVESPLEYLVRVRADKTADVHRYVIANSTSAKLGDSVCGPVDLPSREAQRLAEGLQEFCMTPEEKAAKTEAAKVDEG